MATGAVLIGVYLVARFSRRFRKATRPEHDFELDFTNMMILFHSMRDMLHQQKDLAREINRTVEQKVAYIHKTVEDALNELARLNQTQRTLEVQLDEARYELISLRRRLGDADAAQVPSPDAQRIREELGPPSAPADSLPSLEAPPGPEDRGDEPTLQIVAEPQETARRDDPTHSWVGLDFGEDRPDPLQYDAPEDVPESPEDPQAARDAFRALLNLQPETNETVPADKPGPASGNGHSAQAPLHARVYEYSDAGMSVPQISKELGIGKGEVRLILSLRKDRER